MALNLTLLRSFHAVVAAGSVSKAAREGFASQPGLSKAVRELEKQLGISLLERGARGSRPTKAGAELFNYAHAIFALEAEAEDTLKQHKTLSCTTLSIGASTTIATYILPPILARFRAQYPGVDLSLWRGNSAEIESRLATYELDVALIVGAPRNKELNKTPWYEDEIVGICSPFHWLATRELVYPDDLKGCQWVTREAGSGTRDAIEDALKPYGLSALSGLEIGGCEALKQSVAAGLGIGFVSRQAAADQIALGKLNVIRLAEIEIRSPFYLLHLPNRPSLPASRAFEEFLLKGNLIKAT
jgi:DNA-binding transcriptional LysR family regulator